MITRFFPAPAQRTGFPLAQLLEERIASEDDGRFALSLRVYPEKLTQDGGECAPASFGVREDAVSYPCSVVKLFWLVAAQARLADCSVIAHEELERAMADMIRWWSNTAIN